LGPLAGESGGLIPAQPKMEAMGFTQAVSEFGGRRPRLSRAAEAREAAALAETQTGGSSCELSGHGWEGGRMTVG
jgi:hypothetical protein